jgi:pentatricopeptide repeat protein
LFSDRFARECAFIATLSTITPSSISWGDQVYEDRLTHSSDSEGDQTQCPWTASKWVIGPPSRDHCITPSKDHYSCMINILGHVGHLEEAEKFIQNMPFEPYAIGWVALLGACRSHSNIELGSHVVEQLFKLEPSNAAPYVVLANMYASAGRWNDVSRVRKMMKDREIKKQSGCSWIDINKRVHAFIAEDSLHQQMDEIYAILETLVVRMKEVGYVPDTKFALLHDVGEEYKKDVLSHHSEKMALAFGLMNTLSRTTIQIIKNLCVCGGFHTAFKFISMIKGHPLVYL